MNEIKVFENEMFGKVRIIEKEGNPWFVGKDVAEILGYSNASKAVIAHVDDEDKQFIMAESQNGNVLTNKTKTVIINESGLYCLVLSSKLPIAKAFRRWVTNEVIPSIRKNRVYMTDSLMEDVLTNPDLLIELATKFKEEKTKRLEAENNLKLAEPKVKFADTVQDTESTIYVSDMAKILMQHGVKTGANRLFKKLHEDGYLTNRKNSRNYPSQMSISKGIMQVVETVYCKDGKRYLQFTPKITSKGQLYFLEKYGN